MARLYKGSLAMIALAFLLLCCVSGTEPEIGCEVVIVVELTDTSMVFDTIFRLPSRGCLPEDIITTTITR